MLITRIKYLAGALLIRVATAINPPPAPSILPRAADVAADPEERKRQYERIAFTAIAWMSFASPDERAAAAGVLRRTYPGIGEQITNAYQCAMVFHT